MDSEQRLNGLTPSEWAYYLFIVTSKTPAEAYWRMKRLLQRMKTELHFN